MKVHRSPSSPAVARKTHVVLVAAAAACAHTDRAGAQSVSLVMEEARVQRECADATNTDASPVRQPSGPSTHGAAAWLF
jgi:hypothetical protein